MKCSFCGSNLEINSKSCHYCGYLLNSEPDRQFILDNFVRFEEIDEKEINFIFREWLKKNKFANSISDQISKLKNIKTFYLPLHIISGRGEVLFTYTLSRRDYNLNQIITSPQTNKKYNFNLNSEIVSSSLKIKENFLSGLKPFSFSFLESKRPNIEIIPIGVNKEVAINKIKKMAINDHISYLNSFTKGSSLIINSTKSAFDFNESKLFYIPIINGVYSFKNKDYNFYINVNNKKISGEFPVAKTKILMIFILLPLIAVVTAFLLFLIL